MTKAKVAEMTFGQRVHERRTRLNMSRKELAKKARVSESYIGQIETGRATRLRPHTQERIEEVLRTESAGKAQGAERDILPLLRLIAEADLDSLTLGELQVLEAAQQGLVDLGITITAGMVGDIVKHKRVARGKRS